jgi:hypothetical protein
MKKPGGSAGPPGFDQLFCQPVTENELVVKLKPPDDEVIS